MYLYIVLIVISKEVINMTLEQLIAVIILLLIPIAIWDAVWKDIGMWKSARNNQLGWFICIMIFNTIGILPIVYILFFQILISLNPCA